VADQRLGAPWQLRQRGREVQRGRVLVKQPEQRWHDDAKLVVHVAFTPWRRAQGGEGLQRVGPHFRVVRLQALDGGGERRRGGGGRVLLVGGGCLGSHRSVPLLSAVGRTALVRRERSIGV